MNRYYGALLCAFVALTEGAASAFPTGPVASKARESLMKMFGDSISVSSSTVRLTPRLSDSIATKSKTRWPGDSVRLFECRLHGKTAGYGFLDDVKGKTQLITYLVGLDPDGRVVDIDVLDYRESYGGEIAFETFRKQFRQKSSGDKLIPGKDIRNISGATISVRAITDGVKRILATFEAIRPMPGK